MTTRNQAALGEIQDQLVVKVAQLGQMNDRITHDEQRQLVVEP